MSKLEIYPPVKQGDKPCVRDKCCNQFGERDEIQSVIDRLHADVAQRDERIAELEGRIKKIKYETYDPKYSDCWG